MTVTRNRISPIVYPNVWDISMSEEEGDGDTSSEEEYEEYDEEEGDENEVNDE